MRKVQWMPWWWTAGGGAALALLTVSLSLPPVAWAAGGGHLVISSLLLTVGLRRHRAVRLGPANAVTATRSAMVGPATALAVAGWTGTASAPLFVVICTCALILDAVDGHVARRTGSESALGARFDMEVDAFLLLVLCVYDARIVGGWVLTIGLMRYAFVAAGRAMPWLRRPLPPRYWRKVVTAVCGIVLTLVAARILPEAAAIALVAAALALLVESFGRDVVWLARMNRIDRALVYPESEQGVR